MSIISKPKINQIIATGLIECTENEVNSWNSSIQKGL